MCLWHLFKYTHTYITHTGMSIQVKRFEQLFMYCVYRYVGLISSGAVDVFGW